MAKQDRTRINRGDAPDMEPMFPGQQWLSAWNSPEKFGRYIEGLSENNAWHKGGWEQGDHRDDFSGTKSMSDAIHLAAGNWTQGRDLIEKVTNAVKLEHPVRKQPVKYNIVGVIPNVARAISGNPMNMKEADPMRSKRRVTLTLVSDMSANWSVKAERFVIRAAVLAALLDAIETIGFAVELICTAHSTSYGTHGEVTTAIRVKESHQPLDLARVAFALGHPSMFRRMVFADWGGNEENRHLGHGLGHCSAMAIDDSMRDKHIYFIPNLEGRVQGYFADEATGVKHGLQLFVEALVIQHCPAFQKDPDKFKYYYKENPKSKTWSLRPSKEITGKTDDDDYGW